MACYAAISHRIILGSALCILTTLNKVDSFTLLHYYY
jgi:hypothetical protein